MEKKNIELELDQNLKGFTPEFIFKIFLIGFAIYLLNDQNQLNIRFDKTSIGTSVFTPFLIVFLNISLSLLTIFSTGRRRISIHDYYRTKIISHPNYGLYNLRFTSNFSSSPFKFITCIGAAIFTIINFMCLNKGDGAFNDYFQAAINISVITLSFGGYYLLIWIYRENWISKKILNISVDKKKLSKAEREELNTFLSNYDEDSAVYYINDRLLRDIENKANVFKQRLDTLLLESVFIGALAFSTFIQITSPEAVAEYSRSKKEGVFKHWVYERVTAIAHSFEMNGLKAEIIEKKKIERDQINNDEIRQWTEQEYYFVIATGSLICAVLYISVLLKRFPIIKAIENLFTSIKSAESWNRREEDILLQEVRAEVEDSPDVIKQKLISKRQYYTERLQQNLASCQLLKNKINTNLKIISTIRTIGLYSFFFVLLTATSMISPSLTLVFVFILAYALIGSIFMHEDGRAHNFWVRFTGSEKI